ncbi:MAG: amidohydrolase family protein [Chloroflexi bacterium]|nr:amidohydrolase family protein [Chloroflexota bacterium]
MGRLTFTNARLLGPDGVFASSLRIERGRIAAIDAPLHKRDFVFDLGGALVLPGLINAHDHLELNHFGKLKFREVHANASEWIEDCHPRLRSEAHYLRLQAYPLADRLWIGGIKNLLAGATTVCHHNGLHRELHQHFPVRVVERYGWTHSLYLSRAAVAPSYRRTPKDWPWIIHAAEGTDERAERELTELDALGALGQNTVIVHGVGLGEADRANLIERGGTLVWCPASNLFLLGRTADVRGLASAGRVALGTDSRLTGGRDLLDELRVATATGQASPRDLFRMVTIDAARLLRLKDRGELRAGAPADLVILPPLASDGDVFASLTGLERSDLRLVMIGGEPRVGDAALADIFEASGTPAEGAQLDGRRKLLARWIARRLRISRIAEPGLDL